MLPAVQRSGFLPLGVVIALDHRTGFLDLDIETFFGEVGNPTHSSSHTLHIKYPKQTKKYKEKLLKQFKKERLFQRMKKLVTLTKTGVDGPKKFKRNMKRSMLEQQKLCYKQRKIPFKLSGATHLGAYHSYKQVKKSDTGTSKYLYQKEEKLHQRSWIEPYKRQKKTVTYEHITI